MTSGDTGASQSIGFYSAGCVQGAVSPPPDGPGYQVVRLSRRRYYGHPSLVEFIRKLGRKVSGSHLGTLLIGDLGQPRGGPTGSLHKSHQNGLDVDIWYALRSPRALSLDAREGLAAASVLVSSGRALDPAHWKPAYGDVLRWAAGFPEVERIFVNAVIKRELCAAPMVHGDRAWLSKLRPWWGHDDHFHVRLKCPAGATACQAQEAVPAGDGCDSTLDWWLTDEAIAKGRDEDSAVSAAPLPKLPAACEAVLKAEAPRPL